MMKINTRIINYGKKNTVFRYFTVEIMYYIYLLKKRTKEIYASCLKKYLSDGQLKDKKSVKTAIKGLICAKTYYGFTYDEYFLFGLYKIDEIKWHEYVGGYERMRVAFKTATEQQREIYINKSNTYKIYKEYYKRDLLKIGNEKDYDSFNEFVHKHPKFIAKPLKSSCGNSVRIIDLSGSNEDKKKIFESLCMDKGSVCEELIYQTKEMSDFHSNSVNTVRVVTFYDNNKLTKMFATLRMGLGNSIVDNSSSGGLAATVDINSGQVITEGTLCHDCLPVRYSVHPQSNATILGAYIPKWSELMDLIDELVKVNPQQKLIGWDMALTDNGWVIIEANSVPTFCPVQVCNESGIRTLFEQTLGKYRINAE